MLRLPALSRDGWLLFLTCSVRAFAYGLLSVVLGLYLAALGFDPATIGALFAIALGGAAVMTLGLTTVADRIGRRRILMVGAVLMALAGAVFALTDNPLLLAIAAVVGTINPSTREAGPFPSIEQAILPQVSRSEERTSIFASYNLVRSATGALGALAAGLPLAVGLAPLESYRLLVWVYAGTALVLLALFARLSSAVEATRAPSPAIPAAEHSALRTQHSALRFGIHRSRGMVTKLAGLFALDAFAGGFTLDSLVAYWFYLRYGVDVAVLGAIFFGTNLLSALSFLAAAPLARRIGLLNTMVFTHLPSNVLLILVPLMPSLELAVAMLLARNLLSQLDVPTRQSYTMAVVAPDERAAAAGLLAVSRNAGTAVAPALAGPLLAVPSLGLPFLIGGGLKIVYDLLILATFRRVRPPEETARLGK